MDVQHDWFYWENVCLAVQLEPKQAIYARIEQKNVQIRSVTASFSYECI